MNAFASSRSCCTDFPSDCTFINASTSLGFSLKIKLATLSPNLMKSSVLATKSVSQLTSTNAPSVLLLTNPETIPADAFRPSRLPTSLAPLTLKSSMAALKSPLVSSKAFLQSIMPEPVFSRNFFTSSAE